MITVAVIDDHAVVRMGLKYVIGMDPELKFAGEHPGGIGASQFVKNLCPDVTLLDIYMPDKDGLSALEEILWTTPEQKVLMLTTSVAENDAYRAIEIGAKGYMLKDDDAKDLCKAIKTIAAGGRYVPEQIMRLVDARRRTEAFTPREQCVLNMMAAGHSNEKIAINMGVSVSAVKQHVTHIFSKLGVADRVSAVTAALKKGFVKI